MVRGRVKVMRIRPFYLEIKGTLLFIPARSVLENK